MLKGTTIKAKVHILPADKILITTPARCEERERTIIKADKSGRAYIMVGREGWYYGLQEVYTPQHLYLTVNEEIKGGDYFYHANTGISQCIKTSEDSIFSSKGAHIKSACEKIAATTNPELWKNKWTSGEYEPSIPFQSITQGIPKIDIPFIEAYIKAYNEGKPITEVLLEQAEYINQFNQKGKTNTKYSALKLKSNGSVVVHPVKEKIYTREELKKAIWNFGCKLWIEEYGENPNEEKTNMTEIFNNWFDKKYPE